MRCAPFALAFLTLVLGEARAAGTQPGDAAKEEELVRASPLRQRHTVAQLEAGIVALPTAPISVANRGGSTPFGAFGKGDATLQTGIHLLFRASANWAFGAGAMFAPKPTSDSQYRSLGGTLGIPRTHSRSYLLLGADLRYFFPELRSKWFEAWFGLHGGGIVVADRFVTNAGGDVPTILGTKENTVKNEGLALGAQAGIEYLLSESWVLGLATRASIWILPNARAVGADPACSSIGDCPTLTGTVQAFDVGLTLGYRIPL